MPGTFATTDQESLIAPKTESKISFLQGVGLFIGMEILAFVTGAAYGALGASIMYSGDTEADTQVKMSSLACALGLAILVTPGWFARQLYTKCCGFDVTCLSSKLPSMCDLVFMSLIAGAGGEVGNLILSDKTPEAGEVALIGSSIINVATCLFFSPCAVRSSRKESAKVHIVSSDSTDIYATPVK